MNAFIPPKGYRMIGEATLAEIQAGSLLNKIGAFALLLHEDGHPDQIIASVEKPGERWPAWDEGIIISQCRKSDREGFFFEPRPASSRAQIYVPSRWILAREIFVVVATLPITLMLTWLGFVSRFFMWASRAFDSGVEWLQGGYGQWLHPHLSHLGSQFERLPTCEEKRSYGLLQGKCSTCGSTSVETGEWDIPVNINDQKAIATKVSGKRCDNCGDIEFTPDGARRFSACVDELVCAGRHESKTQASA